MSLTVKESGGTFVPCPAGSHLGICVGIIDLGTQVSPFNDELTGEPKMNKQVFIQWELPNELMANDEPFTIGRFYTASLSEKANLRKDLQAWRGREFTAEELDGFSLKNILGKACLLSVIHYTKKNGSAGAKVGSVMQLTKGTDIPKPRNKMVAFDIEAWDQEVYLNLDEYWRESIANSVEGKARMLKVALTKANGGSGSPIADDDIPF